MVGSTLGPANEHRSSIHAPHNPTCTGAGYPHEHHHSPYASLRRSPARQCAPDGPRARLGRVGPAMRRLWRVSAAGSSMHARDVGVVARCVVARCGVGAAFRRAGSVGVPVVALRCPCCRALFVLAVGPLRLLAAAAACRCPACVPWPRAKADVADFAPAAGMVSALCLTLSRPQNVVPLKRCQCCCNESRMIVPCCVMIQ